MTDCALLRVYSLTSCDIDRDISGDQLVDRFDVVSEHVSAHCARQERLAIPSCLICQLVNQPVDKAFDNQTLTVSVCS